MFCKDDSQGPYVINMSIPMISAAIFILITYKASLQFLRSGGILPVSLQNGLTSTWTVLLVRVRLPIEDHHVLRVPKEYQTRLSGLLATRIIFF